MVNILSPDSLNAIEGTKDLYIFCTKFFLKLYNFVNNLVFASVLFLVFFFSLCVCVLKQPAYRFQ